MSAPSPRTSYHFFANFFLFLTLIKNTLSNFPTHYLSLFPLPVRATNQIEKLFKALLWGGMGEKNNFHIVSWQRVSCLIVNGGLGSAKPESTSRDNHHLFLQSNDQAVLQRQHQKIQRIRKLPIKFKRKSTYSKKQKIHNNGAAF